MAKLAMSRAIREAYAEELTRNPRLIIYGQDAQISLFGDTRGLVDQFGPQRIRNAPISEASMTGMAVGAAMAGNPVICHLLYGNFIYTGFDAIANQAAKMRLMTGGQANLPVTFVAVMGGGSSNAAQHSDTPYPVLMNLGGINVAVPATAADAKGLMKTALRGQDPTVFLIPRSRSGSTSDIPDGDHLVPFGRATVHREGGDVTIVAIGSCVAHALAAATTLERHGIQAEVVDPRTLVPLDEASILASVVKTGHLVVVDEARDRCSAASHIAAVVADRAFSALKAPIRRVTVPNVSIPFAPVLEKAVVPNPDRVVVAALDVLGRQPSGAAA
ncbi:MAG: alpha-ketoacid dehydrogenase subunit beta [Dehalococcoidia bacterium]